MQNCKTKRQLAPKSLDKFLSAPPHVSGEDAQTYAELYAEIEALVEPGNVLERIRVADIANRVWEQQRCRRATGAVIKGNHREALVTILAVGVGLKPYDARATADVYFGLARTSPGVLYDGSGLGSVSLPGNRRGVVRLLERHGFSEADIDHVATQMSLDTLAGLEDLAFKHESRREAIVAKVMRDRERLRRDEEPAAQDDERSERRAGSRLDVVSNQASKRATLQ